MSKNIANEAFARRVQEDLHARGLYTGTVDGWAGRRTLEAWGLLVGDGFAAPRPENSGRSAHLYAHALKDDGLRETPGVGSTPRIREAILGAASWLNPDDSATAWCGCIMGLWVKEVGLRPPTAYYRAASWLDAGAEVPLASARPGDIVVISRTGGNHVALYVAHDAGTITLYGGNQSNAVNMAKFPRSSLRGVRRLA